MRVEVETECRRATGATAELACLGENYRQPAVRTIAIKKTYAGPLQSSLPPQFQADVQRAEPFALIDRDRARGTAA